MCDGIGILLALVVIFAPMVLAWILIAWPCKRTE